MVDLTRSTPTHRLPVTDTERVDAMRQCVDYCAHSHRMHTVDFKLFGTVARIVSIVGVFTSLALVERSPQAAWWWLLAVFALLVLDIAFNPAAQALRHARREGALREMVADLETIATPIDANALTRYELRATQLISQD